MTNKDYELIAQVFRKQYRALTRNALDEFAAAAIEECAAEMAEAFRTENARFNQVKFLRACGIVD